MDLVLRCRSAQPAQYADSIDLEVSLEDVDGRSLNEQAHKILKYIDQEALVMELDSRDRDSVSLSNTKTYLKARIEELECTLSEIRDSAWRAL